MLPIRSNECPIKKKGKKEKKKGFNDLSVYLITEIA